MKFWTVQKRVILNQVLTEGYYQPDFSKSDYTQKVDGLEDLYILLLESFNRHNGSNFPGLIFAFVGTDNRSYYDFPDISTFRDYMTTNRASIASLWKNLVAEDAVIMELEFPNSFNPIYIDMNDFQFLIPPVIPYHPYDGTDPVRLLEQLCSGLVIPSKYCSGILQAHLPYISRENLVAAYEPFRLE